MIAVYIHQHIGYTVIYNIQSYICIFILISLGFISFDISCSPCFYFDVDILYDKDSNDYHSSELFVCVIHSVCLITVGVTKKPKNELVSIVFTEIT